MRGKLNRIRIIGVVELMIEGGIENKKYRKKQFTKIGIRKL